MSDTQQVRLTVTLPNATTGDGAHADEFVGDLRWHIDEGFLHIRTETEPFVAAYAPGTWASIRRYDEAS